MEVCFHAETRLYSHRDQMRCKVNWQGQRGSNPRPTVLETVALPTELYPYHSSNVTAKMPRSVVGLRLVIKSSLKRQAYFRNNFTPVALSTVTTRQTASDHRPIQQCGSNRPALCHYAVRSRWRRCLAMNHPISMGPGARTLPARIKSPTRTCPRRAFSKYFKRSGAECQLRSSTTASALPEMRCASAASMNGLRSPSSTSDGAELSTPVRMSFTIW
jgi:hypothetical protein